MTEDPTRDAAAALEQQVTERTLRLVDRQIGQGEPPSPEEWQALRALAPTADGAALVAELESVVGRFDAQLRAKYGAAAEGGVDVARLRQGLAHLVRSIVHRKVAGATVPSGTGRGNGEVQ